VCADAEAARLHFGASEHQQPGCQIDLTEYRRMEEVNRRHCEEDTELHRALHRMEADHRTELLRAEEAGYAKGLAALKSGWTFERNHNNCIVVRMPDGGGCAVDNVASDARMVPEEVLFALAVALGAQRELDITSRLCSMRNPTHIAADEPLAAPVNTTHRIRTCEP
jgi:hypothetical protein